MAQSRRSFLSAAAAGVGAGVLGRAAGAPVAQTAGLPTARARAFMVRCGLKYPVLQAHDVPVLVTGGISTGVYVIQSGYRYCSDPAPRKEAKRE